MNEVLAREKSKELIDNIKDQFLYRADWKVDSTRREELNKYRETLSKIGPNMAASQYENPPGTQHDITKISKSTGIRCIQLKTNTFNHKVPLDRALMCLELARPHDDPSQIMFPYGFTEKDGGKDKFNITNVIMPLSTFEGISKDISNHFDTDRIYNQSTE